MLYLHLSVADLIPYILYLYLDKLGDSNKHFSMFRNLYSKLYDKYQN